MFDPLGRNVKIVETVSGSVTSTKQFVWCGMDRCEERDGSGSVTKQFVTRGQRNGSTNYFYDFDHLGSILGMTDSSAVSQAQYSYHPYGVKSVTSEVVASDFQYAGMYWHSRSGLNLTWFRAYNANFGRFISRDPLREDEGPNLYAYVGNNPASGIDPLGLARGQWGPAEWKDNAIKHCIASCQMAKMFGKRVAEISGDIVELHDYVFKGQTGDSARMDFQNNAVGREGPFRENCGDYCRRKYEQGGLFGPKGPLVPLVPPIGPVGGGPWIPPLPDPPKPPYCPGPNFTEYNGGRGTPPGGGVQNYSWSPGYPT